jgi:ribosomal protein L17
VLATVPLVAGVKVTIQNDKEFNFEGLKTYAWRLDGANPIRILENTLDKPEEVRKNLEPIILTAVDAELAKKGFKRLESGQPDLYLDYYVLIGPNTQSQYRGQFVGAVPAWGLPDFAMSTSAIKIYEQGSVIIDVLSPAQKHTVWRAKAAAEMDRRRTPTERAGIINEAARKMFEKLPPKFKEKK